MNRALRSARRVLRPRYDAAALPTSSSRWLRASRKIYSSVMEVMESRRLLAATLDESFNGNGNALADFSQADDYAYSTHVLDDGRILVAGYATGGDTGADFAVARFNKNGSLDGTFGDGGLARVHWGWQDTANSMVVDGQGRIVLAGTTFDFDGGFNFAIARLNADGMLDNTFGTGGKATTDFNFGFDQAYAVAVHDDGYVVAGAADFQFALARYKLDGTLDSDFGTNGRVSTSLANLGSEAFTLTVHSDGRILAGGYAYFDDGTESNVALVQYTASGDVDNDFGVFGVAIEDFGGHDDAARHVSVSNGKIYVAGQSHDDMLVARFDADGKLDESFGDEGSVRVGVEFESDAAHDIAFDEHGSLHVAGHTSENSDRDFLVLKLTSSGDVDESFGPGGMFRHDFGSENDSAQSLAFDADGNLVVAGFSAAAGHSDFAVLRLVLTPPNEAPVSNAGGPYTVSEGSSVKLSGAASSDADGSIVKYQWDFNGDGVMDAEGMEVDFSAAKLDDGVHMVTLMVTDDMGATHSTMTTVTVANAMPKATFAMNFGTVRGQAVNFMGGFFDAGVLDTHTIRWDLGDGTVIDWQSTEEPGALDLEHVYRHAGTYTVTMQVLDDDGASVTFSRTFTIGVASLQADPARPGKTALVVGGTTGDDRIRFVGNDKFGYGVYVNDVYHGYFQPTGSLIVYGNGGNDKVMVIGKPRLPLTMVGAEEEAIRLAMRKEQLKRAKEKLQAVFNTIKRIKDARDLRKESHQDLKALRKAA